MARKKSLELKSILPTNLDLLEKVNAFGSLDRGLYWCVFRINENFFSFLCGIVANLPLSALFALLSVGFGTTVYEIAVYVMYVALVVCSALATYSSIKFTVRHIEIQQTVGKIENKEIYNNKTAEITLEKLPQLRKFAVMFTVTMLLSVALIIAMIVVYNVGQYINT